MKKLIIASAFTLLFATGYGQTLADQIYKTDSTWKAFLNDSKEKSNIAWENMLKRESKSLLYKRFQSLKRILILLEIHINHLILFKITEIHPILLNPKRKW